MGWLDDLLIGLGAIGEAVAGEARGKGSRLAFLREVEKEGGGAAGRWITVHGRRVMISADGRIIRGLSPDLIGVHLSQVPAYWERRREMAGACDPATLARVKKPRETYASKKVALEALLAVNPRLGDWVWGPIGEESGNGVDVVNHALEPGWKPAGRDPTGKLISGGSYVDGHGRVVSNARAFVRAIPGGWGGKSGRGRWADLVERMPLLQEVIDASGGVTDYEDSAASGSRRLVLTVPEEAIRLEVDKHFRENCAENVQARLHEYAEQARAGELAHFVWLDKHPGAADADDPDFVPF